ncbi:ERAD-associated ubiquitin-protein ligase [Komagataella phaffii CBS 7435]|uniref:RING-type E3 ubiquitin transferase n=2 Tax=Komagataella phaffii TaxID=460519 RepID=C4R4V2_KOMPG|nr:Ubiquitin-protein ligase of the ER/nuclear envelope [Komagataella phaffii GS115]AOA63248.1 GQ67_03612T0 [Komagataella phaffii]CAH2449650.1 ERAD-associated ubiquitin-protein ligase [Komagataella phaffii CBS 7435]AOA68705.1 GQ68_03583T0 [Komagataella phaffii GS115]CAY70588.1 Ubiquitin-protein ligase of the ER/nuclear envelope [Komagataella phaffii GS115]CCA39623.1 ERAD-associated ubiquitin-protein ligase [Komagataella phaffii CBS 7435]
MEEATCRICRTEATEDDPLYHPCACRGSIKYIHQNCLEEWLKYSSKNSQCDICHQKFSFRVVYDQDTPAHAPVKLILQQIRTSIDRKLFSFLVIISCIVCAILLFSYTTLVLRYSSFLLSFSFVHGIPTTTELLLGQSETPISLQEFFNTDPAGCIRKALVSSLLPGFLFLLALLILGPVIKLNHEWIIRETSFLKMLHNRIGPVHSNERHAYVNQVDGMRIAGILQQIQEQRDANHGVLRRENVDALANNILGITGNEQLAEAMRLAIENVEQAEPNHEENDINDENEINLLNEQPAHVEEGLPAEDQDDVDFDEPPAVAAQNADLDPDFRPFDVAEEPADQAADEPALPEPRAQAEPELDFNLGVPDEPEANNDLFEIMFSLHPALPPLILTAAIFIEPVVLTLLFIIPCLVSFAILDLLRPLGRLINSIPEAEMVTSLFIRQPGAEASGIRIFGHLIIGYSFFAFMVYLILRKIEKSCNPRTNPLRKFRQFYNIVFGWSCTFKVFTLLGIEQLLFPITCGFLMDFCIAPVMVDPRSTGTLLLSQNFKVLNHSLHYMLYLWSIGSSYMFCFATFVGMCRSHILRPGVLFFIRTPDDPNVRLIHEALTRPFFLQLFRIFISLIVYTIFILAGIGSVTWFFGLFTPLLPVVIPTILPTGILRFYMSPLWIAPALLQGRKHKDLVILYWKKAYTISAARVRLSSFILNNPIPEERGRIVYRHFYHRLSATPDYSKPMSVRQATQHFKENPSVNAIFVPDGNYVRVPDDDAVSRKYLKRLFVAVTKDDNLLEPLKEENTAEDNSQEPSYDSDSETMEITTHCVVYRPPHFKARYISFLFLIGFFAISLFVSCIVLSDLLGRLIVLPISLLWIHSESIFSPRINFLYFFIGYQVWLQIFELYQKEDDTFTGLALLLRQITENLRRVLNTISGKVLVVVVDTIHLFITLISIGLPLMTQNSAVVENFDMLLKDPNDELNPRGPLSSLYKEVDPALSAFPFGLEVLGPSSLITILSIVGISTCNLVPYKDGTVKQWALLVVYCISNVLTGFLLNKARGPKTILEALNIYGWSFFAHYVAFAAYFTTKAVLRYFKTIDEQVKETYYTSRKELKNLDP